MIRKLIVIAMLAFLPLSANATGLEPDDPKCPEGQRAVCTMGICTSTAIYYQLTGRFVDGQFIMDESPSNPTSCDWECSCIPDQSEWVQ